jgi:membrane associated rhomboid family serine protease
MSVKGALRDFLVLGALIAGLIVFIISVYEYFVTNKVEFLYVGLSLVIITVLGALVRYRFLVDYLGPLLKKWR